MNKIKTPLLYGLLALLAFLPFHTLVTVWLASSFGHLYLWSAWKEVLVAALGLAWMYGVMKDAKLRKLLLAPAYNRVALAYLLLCTLYVLIQRLTSTAIVGYAINTRFVVMFLVAQMIMYYTPSASTRLRKLCVAGAVVVATLAVLQITILPANLLTHFGYDPVGVNTPGIPPAAHRVAAESSLYRAQSTLRGPNVLGAYLILPIAFACYEYWYKKRKAMLIVAGALGVGLLASYSRSALIGLALGALVWLALKLPKGYIRRYRYALAVMVLVTLLATPLLWRSKYFQTVVLHHNQDITAVQSNEGHLLLSQEAARSVLRDPLGDGLGSAGPSSALADQNDARIAENYYLQVGQEVGWLGFVLFIGLQVSVLVALWQRKQEAYALPVFIAMLALASTNLLLHTWSDEVVSIIAWTFAGLVLAPKWPKKSS